MCGGAPLPGPGYKFAPTVLTNCKQDSEIVQEEIFGPVLPILTFKTMDEAFALACDTKFGLTSSIYTTNVDIAERAKTELRFGETYLSPRGPSEDGGPRRRRRGRGLDPSADRGRGEHCGDEQRSDGRNSARAQVRQPRKFRGHTGVPRRHAPERRRRRRRQARPRGVPRVARRLRAPRPERGQLGRRRGRTDA